MLPLLDTGNFTDGWPSLEKALAIASHIHAKFLKVAADGSDEKVDYARIIPALRATGYDGWVSLEYEAEEAVAAGIPRALAYLKRMLAG